DRGLRLSNQVYSNVGNGKRHQSEYRNSDDARGRFLSSLGRGARRQGAPWQGAPLFEQGGSSVSASCSLQLLFRGGCYAADAERKQHANTPVERTLGLRIYFVVR